MFSVWQTVQRSVLATSRVLTSNSLSSTVAAAAADTLANASATAHAMRASVSM
jgi:NAD dependent epimerase/dehydratase family enzyme